MPRSRWTQILLAALLCLPLLLAATPNARAAETASQTPGAAAAAVICEPVMAAPLPDRVKQSCVDLVEKVWPEDPNTATASGLCAAVTARARFLAPACVRIVDPILGKAVSAAQAVVQAAQSVVEAAKFIANPSDGFEALANHLKESATSLTEVVMTKMNTSTAVDLNADWFRNYYAGSFALGIFVMAIMLFLLYRQVASGAVEEAELAKGLLNGPAVIVAMAFTPVIGQVVSEGATELANGTAGWAAPQIGAYLTQEAGPWALLSSVTMGTIPGGVPVAIFMFLMMFLGSGSVLAGFITQELGAYLAAGALGVAWGMWVHPKWRPKVTRLIYFIVSLLFQKVLLWLILGGVFLVVNNAFEPASARDGFSVLVALMGTAIALLMAGLAPWALLKFAPLMPGGNEHKQSGGGHMTEAVVGGAVGGMGSVAMQRAFTMSRNDTSSSSTTSQSSTSSKGGGAKTTGASSDSAAPASKGWRGRGVASSSASTGSTSNTAGAATRGGGAGAAAGRGGAACGAAATGGALLPVAAAQAATSAVSGALSKGRRVAEESAPQMGGDDV